MLDIKNVLIYFLHALTIREPMVRQSVFEKEYWKLIESRADDWECLQIIAWCLHQLMTIPQKSFVQILQTDKEHAKI